MNVKERWIAKRNAKKLCKVLEKYINSQIEVLNPGGLVLRGRINAVRVFGQDKTVEVDLSWLYQLSAEGQFVTMKNDSTPTKTLWSRCSKSDPEYYHKHIRSNGLFTTLGEKFIKFIDQVDEGRVKVWMKSGAKWKFFEHDDRMNLMSNGSGAPKRIIEVINKDMLRIAVMTALFRQNK